MSVNHPIEIPSSPESEPDFIIIDHRVPPAVVPAVPGPLPTPDSDDCRVGNGGAKHELHTDTQIYTHEHTHRASSTLTPAPSLSPHDRQRTGPNLQHQQHQDDEHAPEPEQHHAYPAPSDVPQLCPPTTPATAIATASSSSSAIVASASASASASQLSCPARKRRRGSTDDGGQGDIVWVAPPSPAHALSHVQFQAATQVQAIRTSTPSVPGDPSNPVTVPIFPDRPPFAGPPTPTTQPTQTSASQASASASAPTETQPTEALPAPWAKPRPKRKSDWRKKKGGCKRGVKCAALTPEDPADGTPIIPAGLTARLEDVSVPPTQAQTNGGGPAAPGSVPVDHVGLGQAPTQGQAQGTVFDTVEVRNTGTRGRGLYALQSFRAGEVIFKEKPLLLARMNESREALVNKMMSLSYHDLKALLWLETSGGYKPVTEGLLQANGIPCPERWDDEGEDNSDDDDDEYDDERMGIFQTVGKINHSCVPNAGWFWSPLEERLLLIAFRPISAGDELLASYIGDDKLLMNRKQRRQLIKAETGFLCACELCTEPPKSLATADPEQYLARRAALDASEANRERIAVLRKTWDGPDFIKYVAEPDILVRLHEAATLVRRERLVGPLVDIYSNIFYVLAIWGQKELARQAAEIAFDALTCIRGRQMAERHFIKKWCDKPSVWGSYGFKLFDDE